MTVNATAITTGTDALTGLAGYSSSQIELAAAVARANERGEVLSLAMIDVDRLKIFNDCFGKPHGDMVLRQLADALAHAADGWMAFRTGGDSFAVLIPGRGEADAKQTLATRLDRACRAEPSVSFTSGIATHMPGDGDDSSVLWERASASLSESKRSGRGQIVTYSDVAKFVTVVTPSKVKALRSLLAEPRLEIAFQPIWDLGNECLLGMEALARPWSGYGFEGPAEMFVIAEKIGRAHELDAMCVAATLSRAPELPPGAELFLNVNPQSLVHDTVTPEFLLGGVEKSGLTPGQIVLEVTEQSDARLDIVVDRANCFVDHGFQLALDDVGAGNAGLAMLCEMPVNYIKLDHSVISQLLTSIQARAVLISIALFAFRVDAHLIAEGIETPEILEFVRNAHHLDIMRDPPITGAQGYLLGRPSVDISLTPLTIQDALPAPPTPPIADTDTYASAA
ncbi:MAG: EAL domain-containing protein [Solirubrobacterales bacterium]